MQIGKNRTIHSEFGGTVEQQGYRNFPNNIVH